MNFYETVAGKRFFDGQMPKLTKSLERIADALEGKRESVVLPVKLPENFLEELYYGNIPIGVSSEEGYSSDLLKQANELQQELEKKLPLDIMMLFEQYMEESRNYYMQENRRMFQHGYCLAVRLIAAGLQEPEKAA